MVCLIAYMGRMRAAKFKHANGIASDSSIEEPDRKATFIQLCLLMFCLAAPNSVMCVVACA